MATFNGLSIDKVGTGYKLNAGDGGLAGTTSNGFNITSSTATQLAFGQQPTNATAGTNISPAVIVLVQDANGNTVNGNNANVTLAITTNPPGNGVLNGSTTVAAVNGVATFGNLSLNKAGAGYVLTATAGALTSPGSSGFNITPGTAVKLVFGQQPTGATADANISPAVTVLVQDTNGNTVPTDSSSVTLAIGTNPGGGTLSGTTKVVAVNGVATFSGVSIDKAGTAYTLSASDGSLAGVTSNGFNITSGAAAQLAFGQQPSNATAGANISPAVTVLVQDSHGNTVTADSSTVTLAIGTNPGGGTLVGTKTVAAVSGVATFSNLSIDKVGSGYALTAGDGALGNAASNGFDITVGAAAKLAFAQQPGNTTAGASINPAVTVLVQDANGNMVTTDSSTVTLAIGTNPGSGTLSGNTAVAAVNGVATFSDLSINKAGTAYTLTAGDGALAGATSSPFNIMVGAAAKLAFGPQPSNTTAGASISPAVTVLVQDASGNTVTSDNSSVSLTITANPGGGTLVGTTTVAVAGGAATFGNLSINKTGNGYVLTAANGVLPNEASNSFNIMAGPAVQLAYLSVPSSGTAGTPFSVTVQSQDAENNPANVTSATSITLSKATGGSTLSGNGSLTGTIANGANNVTINTPVYSMADTMTLTASATAGMSLTAVTSGGIVFSAGVPTKLAFIQQPTTAIAGASISPAMTVLVQDANGNTVLGDTSNVSLALSSNPGGGTLSGTTTVAAVNGLATFSGLSIDKSGTGYVLTASAGTLTNAASNSFNIIIGTAVKLAFLQQPTNAMAGVSISPAVTVLVQDANGNTVINDTSSVALAITTNPGSGTLSGITTVSAVNGLATFSNLSLDRPGTGYVLTATDGTLSSGTSSGFNITVGVPAKLVFVQQPGNTTAGATITPALTVLVQDSSGNTVSSDTSSVALAITTNPGSGTLSGNTSVAAVNGIATFSNLSINKAGAGYVLTASDGTLSSAASNGFNITVGAAAQLAFGQQPSAATAGFSITPAMTVLVQDAYGNTVTDDTSNVSVAISYNPGGGTLSGTTTVAAVNGVATFSGLSIDQPGAGYVLTATDGALGNVPSNAFNIAGTAAKLAFAQQPTNSTAGASITPAVTVLIQDANGSTVTNDTSSVTLTIAANPGSGTLAGTTTVAAVNGVATFGNLSINNAGQGYTLAADDGSLTGATSSSFNIAGAPAKLAFAQQPANTVAGASITPAVTVLVQDANGSTVTNNSSNVTVSLGNNPAGGTLSGAKTAVAVNGVATFSGLSIDKAGTGYTLTAADGALTGATSSGFNITVGAAAKLAFVQQPNNAAAGASISPAVTVVVQDAYGNTVSGDTSNVTLALTPNPSGGTLSGTTTVAAVNSLASFSGLSINKAGTGYTLTAADGALTGATSNAFSITAGTAAKLAFAQQPSSAAAGANISPAVTVLVQDANGNLVTTDSSTVTLALGTNPPGNGTLSGTTAMAAVNGIATFNNLSIDKAGTGYTLTAADGSLTGATSNGCNITAGAAAMLVFGQQPTSAAAGASITPAVTILVQDAFGNMVTGNISSVSVAISTNPPGNGTLAGTTTVAVVNGTATFSNLSINKIGAGYTLTATDSPLTSATSGNFNITAGAAAQLAFGQAPYSATAGVGLTPAVTVLVQDANGNMVTTDSSAVTVFIGTNAGGGTLAGTTTVAAVNGVATFNGLSINKSGTGYTLMATDGALTSVTSSGFNIVAGAPVQLAFGQQPVTTGAGASITPPVTVLVQDTYGNTVTGNSSSVSVAISTNPPGNGTLSGTKTVAAVNGVATFSNLSIDKLGTGYVLTATDGALISATSGVFNIIVGAPAKLVFAQQPLSATAGASISPAVTILVEDIVGNTVSSDTSNVTLAITTNPGGGTLSGSTTVAAASGVATFSNLSINKAGTGYVLTATDGALTSAASNGFNITPGAAAQLAFGQQPTNATAGASISPAVTVLVQDTLGNTVTGDASSVSLALTNNPGNGTFSGTATVTAANGVATFNNLSLNKVRRRRLCADGDRWRARQRGQQRLQHHPRRGGQAGHRAAAGRQHRGREHRLRR